MSAGLAAMRVAWLVPGSLDEVSGGYVYDRLVVEGLCAAGDEVTVVSLQRGDVPALDTFDAVVGDELAFPRLGPLFRAHPRARRVMLVHHLACWEMAPSTERDRTDRLERAALDASDTCIATSPATAERLVAEGFVRSAAVVVPGADRLPVRTRARGDRGPVRFLHVGNVLPHKRLLELLEALAALDPRDAELVAIGDPNRDPEYAAHVHTRVREMHASGVRVHARGLVSDHDLAQAFADADALVLPSAVEGYGMAMAEALHAGLPVIAADVGAARELAARTSGVVVVKHGDAGALRAALHAFATDASLRERLRDGARRAREHLPPWSDTVTRFRDALQALRR